MPTAVQWLHHLAAKVQEQRAYAKPFEERYTGKHVLDFIVREYAEVYGSAATAHPALKPPQTGIAAIGVDALTGRLTVQGVVSQQDDDEARRVVVALERAWEDNDLDVMHREAHREALIKRSSYGLVSRGVGGKAVASIEACEQVAVHREQAPPYDIDAAAKFLTDEWTGQQRAKLWLRDDNVEVDFVLTETSRLDPDGSGIPTPWQVEDDRPLAVRNRVPLVEFANRPRLLAAPVSDIEQIASLADIADLCEGLMVFAGHFGAVPIRYATGLEIPRDPLDPSKPLTGPDGKPVIGFDARADRLWVNTSKDGKFGQLEPAGLASFVAWADHMAEKIRAKTSIPVSYYGAGVKTHMTAELLKTDEAPMVRRVLGMGRDGHFGQSWRRFLRMMGEVEGLPDVRAYPRWADPETRVESQATDSAQKQVQMGLGVRVVAEKTLGWSPELVERAVAEAEQMRAAAAFDLSVLSSFGPTLADAG